MRLGLLMLAGTCVGALGLAACGGDTFGEPIFGGGSGGTASGGSGGSGGGKWRIMALHHHLIPIPGTGRERNIPVDAGDVLELVAELGVDMVISGHKHLPWVWRLNDTHLITAGTACSRRLKGRSYPSFNLFEISDKKIALRQFNVSDKTSQAKLEIGR